MKRVGVIGLGMASAPHALSLLDLRDKVEVAGVFSPSPERRAAFADRYGFPQAESLDRLLADPSVDAVIVLTPPSTHLDIVSAAAAAGKHVLLEKPLEITFERSQAMVDAAEKTGVRLGVVLQNRFRRTILEVGETIRSGGLGEIVGVSVRLSNWRPQTYYDEPGRGTKARDGGGVLLTQGIHALDQMIALVGLPEEVTGYVATSKVHRMETEDVAHAAMRFANGALGAVSATTAAYPGFPDSFEILGTAGSARLDSSGGLISLMDGTERSIADSIEGSGVGADPMAFSHDNHRAVLEDFITAIESGRDPVISGREALKVHRMIDAIIRSSEHHTPIRL